MSPLHIDTTLLCAAWSARPPHLSFDPRSAAVPLRHSLLPADHSCGLLNLQPGPTITLDQLHSLLSQHGDVVKLALFPPAGPELQALVQYRWEAILTLISVGYLGLVLHSAQQQAGCPMPLPAQGWPCMHRHNLQAQPWPAGIVLVCRSLHRSAQLGILLPSCAANRG